MRRVSNPFLNGLLAALFSVTALSAAGTSWLDLVSPIMSRAERKAYLEMNPEGQEKFREAFWASKSISADEYFKRLQYVDAMFGSTKTGSGANTDQGRVYLSLGPPNRITRVPSSRIFVPLEIWYYETVPAVNLTTELRLIFYQKNSLGIPKLYSPTLDTIRALLLPEAGTIGMFGPNDDINESMIRSNLTLDPSEDEVVSAAVNVATGLTGTGNDEILGEILSPRFMLDRQTRTNVQSHFIPSHPKLDVLETVGGFGGMQVDLSVETEAKTAVGLEVRDDTVVIYQDRLQLNFKRPSGIQYLHRLDLLPGAYTIFLSVDGYTHPYALTVASKPEPKGILRATVEQVADGRRTPFEFDGQQLRPDTNGEWVMIPVSEPQKVTWDLRKGFQIVWRSTTDARQLGLLHLPIGEIPAGRYKLEATTTASSYATDLTLQASDDARASEQIISYNANLAPSLRYAAIGHQWLLRGNIGQAKQSLRASLDAGATQAAEIELARVDALSGNLDDGRDLVRNVLRRQPKNFEALAVLAYIEAKFQDYRVAADLYRQALAVQDSVAVREALAQLPQR